MQELEDIKDGIAWLKQKPYVDGSRIGMSGHSYGGFMTAYAMTHSDLFAAGIAGAPVTDWRDYDSIYTERYMGLPQDNPEGYDATSVVKAARNLHGKLLIIHGAIDDNVSVRNTMRLVEALQAAEQGLRADDLPRLAARHLRPALQPTADRLHPSDIGSRDGSTSSGTASVAGDNETARARNEAEERVESRNRECPRPHPRMSKCPRSMTSWWSSWVRANRENGLSTQRKALII